MAIFCFVFTVVLALVIQCTWMDSICHHLYKLMASRGDEQAIQDGQFLKEATVPAIDSSWKRPARKAVGSSLVQSSWRMCHIDAGVVRLIT